MIQIRILVVDDHPLFRQGVINALREEPGMIVSGEADTAVVALEKARDTLPDVVLLDLKLPDSSGLSVVSELQAECPYTKVVVLTAVEDEDALLEALKSGAHGYLLKGISSGELIRVVRSVAAGEAYVTAGIAGRMLREMTSAAGGRHVGFANLTVREKAILELVAHGLTNKEIAGQFCLSVKTVKHYMTNILQKLQVRNRVEAALMMSKKKNAL